LQNFSQVEQFTLLLRDISLRKFCLNCVRFDLRESVDISFLNTYVNRVAESGSRNESEAFGWSRIPNSTRSRCRKFCLTPELQFNHFLHHTPKLEIPIEMVQFPLKLLLKQKILAVYHTAFRSVMQKTFHSCISFILDDGLRISRNVEYNNIFDNCGYFVRNTNRISFDQCFCKVETNVCETLHTTQLC